jgi:hypothetical protein
MRKVLITEEQLQRVIKNTVTEALGVPENIINTSLSVYNEFMNQLRNKDYSYNSSDETYHFSIPMNLTISDFNISEIMIELVLKKHPQIKEITLLSMGFMHGGRIEEANYKVTSPKTDEVRLQIIFGILPNNAIEDVIPYIEQEENRFISVITHELKHSYDNHKLPHKDPRTQANYRSLSEIRSAVKPMDEFLHFMYFTHQIENIVRPSEVSSRMATNRTTQETFRKFIENDETYVMLKKISEFSLQDFFNELKQEKEQIQRFYKAIGIETKATTDDELVVEFLGLIYVGLINAGGSALQELLTSGPMEAIFGLRGDKGDYLEKYVASVAKFKDDPTKFFISESNRFKKMANIVMRKLRKLYAELPEQPAVKQKSQSIYEWDLYHQVFPPKKNYFK